MRERFKPYKVNWDGVASYRIGQYLRIVTIQYFYIDYLFFIIENIHPTNTYNNNMMFVMFVSALDIKYLPLPCGAVQFTGAMSANKNEHAQKPQQIRCGKEERKRI